MYIDIFFSNEFKDVFNKNHLFTDNNVVTFVSLMNIKVKETFLQEIHTVYNF